VPILFWVVLLAFPIALIMAVYLIAIVRGVELIWETLPGTLFPGLDRRIYTVVVATLGGLLVGVVMRLLGHAGHKTLQQELTEEGRVEYRGALGLLIAAIVGLSSGASLGPEGPLAHMGGGIATWLAERRQYSVEKKRVLSLSGIATVFGGYLGTPVGGAFLSIEFTGLLRFPLYENFIAGTLAALVGFLIVQTVSNYSPAGLYDFPDPGLQPSYWLYAVGLGLVGVLHAFAFKYVSGATKRLTAPLQRWSVLKTMIGGPVFGLIGAFLPLTLFSGEAGLEVIIEQGAEIGLAMLLVLSVVELFTLSVCLQTGFPGGFIFPILFSAGALGAAINVAFPAIPLTVAMLCVMAGVGGALMRLPFSIILLLALLTTPDFAPFLIVSALTGFLIATFAQAGNARRTYQEAAAKRES
jgi:H+/Cl- antiporter ClcA